MFKRITTIFILIMFMILFVACNNTLKLKPITSNTAQTTSNVIDNSAQGGMSNEGFTYKYSRDFVKLDGILLDMAGSNDIINNWIQEFEDKKRDGTECNQLTFINDFNISKDSLLREINKRINDYNMTRQDVPASIGFIMTRQDAYSLTDEQIDIMYSGDMKLINKTFISKAAILYNDEIYTPAWIASNSIEKINEIGIPVDTLKSKLAEWENDESIFIDPENIQKLHEKVSAYENAYGVK